MDMIENLPDVVEEENAATVVHFSVSASGVITELKEEEVDENGN